MARTGTLGSLFIDLAANTATFETDMGRAARIAEQHTRSIQQAFERTAVKITEILAGIEIGKKLFDGVADAIKQFDEVGKAAQKIGIGTEKLSELKYAANLAGVQFDALTLGLEKFDKATIAARNGSQQQLAAFQALGISLKDLKTNSPDELLKKVATAFAGVKDGADKTAITMALFGKAGAELIPFLNIGRKGIEEAAAEAHKFNVAVDEETAKAADEFEKNMVRLEAAAHGFYAKVGLEALPGLIEFQKRLQDPANLQAAQNLADGVIKVGTAVAQFTIDFAGAMHFIGESLAAREVGAQDLQRIDDSLGAINARLKVLKQAAADGAGAWQKLNLTFDESAVSASDRNKTGATYSIEREIALLDEEKKKLEARQKLLQDLDKFARASAIGCSCATSRQIAPLRFGSGGQGGARSGKDHAAYREPEKAGHARGQSERAGQDPLRHRQRVCRQGHVDAARAARRLGEGNRLQESGRRVRQAAPQRRRETHGGDQEAAR